MGGLGVPELLIILFILGGMVLPVWGIVDAAIRPDPVWAAAGQNKVVWVIIQIFLWTLGAVIYFVAIRPKLVAAADRPARAGLSPTWAAVRGRREARPGCRPHVCRAAGASRRLPPHLAARRVRRPALPRAQVHQRESADEDRPCRRVLRSWPGPYPPAPAFSPGSWRRTRRGPGTPPHPGLALRENRSRA